MTPEELASACAAAMWADDRASQALGMSIDAVGPGTATLRMTVRADMVNGHAIGHGGLTFALADSTFAFACNTYNRRTVAAAAEVRFRAPTRLGDVLVASATERCREGRDGTYDVTVVVESSDGEADPGADGGPRVVATFVGRSREIGGTLLETAG